MDMFLTWAHAYPVFSLKYADIALNLLLQYWFNSHSDPHPQVLAQVLTSF